MRFLVLMTEEQAFDRWNAATDERRETMREQLREFSAAVAERGAMLAGEALRRPEEARTLRPGAGRPVREGPFAETVEQLGGFYLVDLPDLETAVDTARMLPDSWTVEVRPVEEMPEGV
jgi:hypothetical protein